METRLVIDETGKRYNAIVPKDRIIFAEDDFEEVSIDGSGSRPMKKHTLSQPQPIFTCRICKVFFSNCFMLNRHLKAEHRKLKIPKIFNALIEKVRQHKSIKPEKTYTIVTPTLTVAIKSTTKSVNEENVHTKIENQFEAVDDTEIKSSLEIAEVKSDQEYIASEFEPIDDSVTTKVNDSGTELVEGDMEYVDNDTEFPEDNGANFEALNDEDEDEKDPLIENQEEILDPTVSEVNQAKEETIDQNPPEDAETTLPESIVQSTVAQHPPIEIIFTASVESTEPSVGQSNIDQQATPEEFITYSESDIPLAVAAADVPKEAITVEVETEKDPRDNMIENDDYRCAVVEIITEQNNKKVKIYGKAYYCAYCNFECKSRGGMYVHISKTHKEWPLAVARREAARLHQAKMKGQNLKFVCYYCPFIATNRATLVGHSRRKHPGLLQPMPPGKKGPRILPWQCPLCDFTSNCKRKHETHMERKHVTELRYACQFCSKKFKTKVDLGAHIKFQHVKCPVVCDVCGKVCSNSNALHVHQKREHFLPKYECHLCRRRMVSQANLDEHIIKQHENRQKFMCENCGKVFNQHSKLVTHSRTHTGEKPHPCSTCGKSFARRAVLRQHMMIHTGERPYICDICGKTFAQKPGLICHRKSHPGEKPPLPVVYIDHILKKYEKAAANPLSEGEDS